MNHRKEIVADSSSLILMSKIGIIHHVIKKNILYIPRTVFEESIKKGLEKGHKDAIELNKYYQDGQIEIIEASYKTKTIIAKLSNLHEGERDAISIAYEKNIPIICDDKRGRNTCKALQLKLSSAITILLALYNKKSINISQILEKLDQLKKFGWYDNEIIDNIKTKMR